MKRANLAFILVLALIMAACAEKPEHVETAETVKPTVKPVEQVTPSEEKVKERTLSTATTSLFASSGNLHTLSPDSGREFW